PHEGPPGPPHLHWPSAGSQVEPPVQCTPAQRVESSQARTAGLQPASEAPPSAAQAQVWPATQSAPPQRHCPEAGSHWVSPVQGTLAQSVVGSTQLWVPTWQAWPAPQTTPPSPPHLHWPSPTSQVSPPWQTTPVQRVFPAFLPHPTTASASTTAASFRRR